MRIRRIMLNLGRITLGDRLVHIFKEEDNYDWNTGRNGTKIYRAICR